MRIVNEKTLDLFRGPGKCEWCGRLVRRREPHHIFGRGYGGAERVDVKINLIALCAVYAGGANCHHELHQGRILRADLLAKVAAREGMLQAEVEAEVRRLRNAPKGTPYP